MDVATGEVAAALGRLRTADAAGQQDALTELCDWLVHQGMIDEESVTAVPALLDAAADPDVGDRYRIELLALLAMIVHPETFVTADGRIHKVLWRRRPQAVRPDRELPLVARAAMVQAAGRVLATLRAPGLEAAALFLLACVVPDVPAEGPAVLTELAGNPDQRLSLAARAITALCAPATTLDEVDRAIDRVAALDEESRDWPIDRPPGPRLIEVLLQVLET